MNISRSIFIALGLCLGSAAMGEPYQLVPGDRVTLHLTATGTSSDMTVDVDGQLRIPGLGGVTVAGSTLDAAEEQIEQVMSDAGVFLSPDVSMSVIAYAPILIAGDVLSPGQLSFVPGMTVGSALAMSGGSRSAGTSRLEVERARLDNESSLLSLNLAIAGSVLSIARLEALLEGADSFEVTSVGLAKIPAPETMNLAQLQKAEADLFRTTRQLISEAAEAWDAEIELIEKQLSLFDDRAAVLQEILETTQDELEAARSLSERGLQTATRLNSAVQREADARARLLDLESSRVAAVQALAEAQRGRANFLRNRREDWLVGLQQARLAIADNQIKYANRLERQAILTDGSGTSLLLGDLVEVSFALTRSGAAVTDSVTLTTPVRPGDFLVVTMQVAQDNTGATQ